MDKPKRRVPDKLSIGPLRHFKSEDERRKAMFEQMIKEALEG